MTSHLHVMGPMGLSKQEPQLLRAPTWHPKRPSNLCSLITEELKGKISIEEESLCPIQGAFRSYSNVRRAFWLKMEPHTPGSLGDVSGTESSQKVQMTVILKSYMESNNWCHGSTLINSFFVSMEGTGAPCMPAFYWLGCAGQSDHWSSTWGPCWEQQPSTCHPQHCWDLSSLGSHLLKLPNPFKSVPDKV